MLPLHGIDFYILSLCYIQKFSLAEHESYIDLSVFLQIDFLLCQLLLYL